jgi:hypothetical protein
MASRFRLRTKEDDQELTRHCATRRLGSDAFQEAHSAGIWLPGEGLGRLVRFTGAGSLLYHHSDHLRKPNDRALVRRWTDDALSTGIRILLT